jgi:toxin ParE1/3/4
MGFPLKIRDEALADIVGGYFWYEEKRNELGKQFISELDSLFDCISTYPELFQVKPKMPYREAVLRTFPFVVVYSFEVQQKTVVVYAVFPTNQNPQKKPQK